MTLRPLLALALVTPAVAVAVPPSSAAPGGEAAAGAASTTLLPSHPVRSRVKAPAGTRTAAARSGTPAAQPRPLAPARAGAARVVPVSGAADRPGGPAAEPLAARDGSRGGFEGGVVAGYEAAGVAGVSCRLDGVLPVAELGPRVGAAAVVSLGWSRLGGRIGLMDLRADVLKLVPAARFTVPLGTRFSIFADAGFGVAYVGAHLASADPAVVTVTAPKDRSVNAMARVGVGAWLHATRRLKIGAIAELDPIFGDLAYTGAAAQTTFLVQGGVMFRP